MNRRIVLLLLAALLLFLPGCGEEQPQTGDGTSIQSSQSTVSLADRLKITDVEKKIEAIGNVVTVSSSDAVSEAREAYYALSAELQANVSNKDLLFYSMAVEDLIQETAACNEEITRYNELAAEINEENAKYREYLAQIESSGVFTEGAHNASLTADLRSSLDEAYSRCLADVETKDILKMPAGNYSDVESWELNDEIGRYNAQTAEMKKTKEALQAETASLKIPDYREIEGSLQTQWKAAMSSEPVFLLYLDIRFEGNMFLDRYGIDLYLDNEKIASLQHGQSYGSTAEVTAGDHEIVFVSEEGSDVTVRRTVTVSEDTTFRCTVKTHGHYIELRDDGTVGGTDGSELYMPSVVNMSLPDARKALEDAGFRNVTAQADSSFIVLESNWTVTGQNIPAGETADQYTEIILTCHRNW